jgi:acetyltransferase EpsM
MKNDIYILGARLDGHAGIIVDTIKLNGDFRVAGYIDNTPNLIGKILEGIPVIGSSDEIDKFGLKGVFYHVAIGDNVARKNLYKKITKFNGIPTTIIHPTAIVSENCKIGIGSFIGPGVIVNNGCKIGKGCIINSGSILEHDNIVGNYVHVAPGVVTAGRVNINDLAFIGVGSVILPDINIGEGSIVGGGSTVVKNVASQNTVIGYAAKQHKKNIYVTTGVNNIESHWIEKDD